MDRITKIAIFIAVFLLIIDVIGAIFMRKIATNRSLGSEGSIWGNIEIICNGFTRPLSITEDENNMVVLENIDTHKKEVYKPINGEFYFKYVPGRYMIKPWYDMEFAGFIYVDSPTKDIKILIVDCE